jgi:Tfp pilus assembly protein PilN
VLDIKSTNDKEKANSSSHEIPRPKPPKLEFPALEAEKNYLMIFSIIAVVIVLILGVFFSRYSSTRSEALKTKHQQEQDLLARLNNSSLSDLNKQITDLDKALAASGNQNSAVWSAMFSDLEGVVPKDLKLTNFSLDEANAVKLSGESNSYSTVAKLIRSMEGSKRFSNVKLVSSSVSDTPDGSKVNFSISLKVNTSSI